MIFNYIKLALRLLARNPFSTVVNILGLSLGFAVFIVLWQYAQTELQSDQFHKDHERIYRAASEIRVTYDKKVHQFTNGYDTPIHAIQLAESIPQIESYTRIYNQDNFNNVWVDDHTSHLFFSVQKAHGDEVQFMENHVAYADPNVFDFFGIALREGNASTALNTPNAVVISRAVASKYFGAADPIGKIILLNNVIPLIVRGVFTDLPRNTHMEVNIVISLLRLKKNISEFQIGPKGSTINYLKFKQGTSIKSLERLLEADNRQVLIAASKKTNDQLNSIRTVLQPLDEIAFSNLQGDHFVSKSKVFLIVLNTIAAIILMVAWINYINLTLGANIKRAQELATRKSLGAKPLDFIKQFLLESTTVNVIAILVAFTLIQISKGALGLLFDFQFYDLGSTDVTTWAIALGALVLGILITGIWPAFATFKINTQVLSGLKISADSRSTRGATLVVIQYTCALVLIIGAFAIQRQLTYILDRDLGINREGIVVVDLPIKKGRDFKTLLNDFQNYLSDLPFVDNFSVSNNVVGDREENGFFVKHATTGIGFVPDSNGGVDENFLKTYKIKLLAGRNFLPQHPADTSTILISRQGVANLQYDSPEDIIGQRVLVQQADYSTTFHEAEVIGVFEDYKRNTFFSDQISIRKGDDVGIALTYGDHLVPAQDPRKLSLSISTNNLSQSMELIRKKYNELFEGNAFSWNLIDDNINKYYVNEKIARNQMALFSVLAIVIACLGLLGTILQRIVMKTKEIGIRKVMGARLHHIAVILLVATVKQIGIAVLIALPLSWYVIDKYLQRFSARLYPQWWHYLLPALILVFIMLASVVVLVFRASRRNPVEALRYE